MVAILGIATANRWRESRTGQDTATAPQGQLAGVTAGQNTAPGPLPVSAGEQLAPRNLAASTVDASAPDSGAGVAPAADASEQELMQDLEYRKARSLADGHAAALAKAGAPLDAKQARAIALALRDEQKSLKHDIIELARTVDLANPQTQMDAQYALKRRQEASNQRVFDALYSVLSAQQMYLLRARIEEQDAARAAAQK